MPAPPQSDTSSPQSSGGFELEGCVVDLFAERVFPGRVRVEGGRIAAITPLPSAPSTVLCPGFVDAHVHLESSMLTPPEFARAAVRHGTVATVSDPHEIANVLGVAGVEFMLRSAEQTPLKVYFGAPSCVPATGFETAGASLSVDEVARLLDDPRILYLSEMMNYPGVLNGDPDCLAKIRAARDRGKPVDGHAPGLRGDEAARYVAAGITTDHECVTKEEALEKLAAGCKIAIREGSAARNFDALHTLLAERPEMCLLCSDDKHPDELDEGHIDALVRRAVAAGVPALHALRAACRNPVEHYGLDVGLLRVDDAADLIAVDSLEAFRVERAWIGGRLVAEGGESLLPRVDVAPVNRFAAREVAVAELAIPAAGPRVRAIVAEDGQLVTGQRLVDTPAEAGRLVSDPRRDVLKIAVVNRYEKAPTAVAVVVGTGLKRGAIASSVAHDSHNVIAVGVADDDLAEAINLVMRAGGGLSAACGSEALSDVLPLPVAGLMATGDCRTVGAAYARLDRQAKSWGAALRAPYMTLSFMALLVIPSLKLSDRGLFDGERFEFTDLFV